MRTILPLLFIILSLNVLAAKSDGLSLKYFNGCEMDLTGDKISDIAMDLETFDGKRKLVVLVGDKNGNYKSFVVAKGRSSFRMSCEYGGRLIDREDPKKIITTSGAYLKLEKPESSTVAYYWYKSQFKEIWIND